MINQTKIYIYLSILNNPNLYQNFFSLTSIQNQLTTQMKINEKSLTEKVKIKFLSIKLIKAQLRSKKIWVHFRKMFNSCQHIFILVFFKVILKTLFHTLFKCFEFYLTWITIIRRLALFHYIFTYFLYISKLSWSLRMFLHNFF